jgi:hypothetical protein
MLRRATVQDVLTDPEVAAFIDAFVVTTPRWGRKMRFSNEVSFTEAELKWIPYFRSVRVGSDTKEALINLVEILEGVSLKKLRRGEVGGLTYEPYIVVVPIAMDDTGHDYEIDNPIAFFRGETQFMKQTGLVGNNLTRIKANVRPATNEEILEYFHALIVNNAERFVILMEAYL